MSEQPGDDAPMTKPPSGPTPSITPLLSAEIPPLQPNELGRLAGYRLLSLLGEGGMGRVYRAYDETLRRHVALKMMLPAIAANADHRRRFLREARAMAALDHEHIMSILHVHDSEDAGAAFFVMPLLRGETLHERLKRERPSVLPVADVLRIARQTAEGLAHAHGHGLIHRDIKPGNLWLEADTQRVKILDFGLVRMEQESSVLTQTGQGMGTYGYMAPEQAADAGHVDHRCDQYGLGCVLYRLCTGQLAMGRFREPQRLNPRVPAALADLIMRLLSTEPGDRFGNMHEVAARLHRLEQSTALVAPAVPAAPRPPRPERAGGEGGLPASFTNAIGMKLVLIPAGKFLMGSPPGEPERRPTEHQHEVEITRPFYLGVHPVTQRQWAAVMGSNPSWFCAAGGGKDQVAGLDTSDFPVDGVSWYDAYAFLVKLNERTAAKETGYEYRLPTEAEWEYACRAGSKTAFHFGDTISDQQANYNKHLGGTSKVGSYSPNAFGLHDMHGNVWEWCLDWFQLDYYWHSPAADPRGPATGSDRVIRGGSWLNLGWGCRSADRLGSPPRHVFYYLGFRAALVPLGE